MQSALLPENLILNIQCWLNHLPYLLSNSYTGGSKLVSIAEIKDFSTNYMMGLSLNQAHMLLKLINKYYIVLICSFESI